MEKDNTILGLGTIRRNRGVSLEQIAEVTKISKRSLEAIEEGEFQKLPGGIYDTSYIRQYARAIDFDESRLLAFYYEKTGQRVPGLPPPRNGEPPPGGRLKPAML